MIFDIPRRPIQPIPRKDVPMIFVGVKSGTLDALGISEGAI